MDWRDRKKKNQTAVAVWFTGLAFMWSIMAFTMWDLMWMTDIPNMPEDERFAIPFFVTILTIASVTYSRLD